MKQAYASLSPATGAQVAGICTIQVAPREWLATDAVIDFATGKVSQALSLISGKSLLTLELTPDSYDYNEKPKSNKSGTYVDISCTGTLNTLDDATQQVLESFRHHELVCIVKDRKKRSKLVGNKNAGAVFQFGYRQSNNGGGTEVATVDISMEAEERPPFYL